MRLFHEIIKESRLALGYPTAKEFHRKKSQELSMSYESYANLEAGKYLPPADKISNLILALEIGDLKGFIYSYCFTLMPNDLFKEFFVNPSSQQNSVILKTDSYSSYKEKFQALLEFNRMQTKFELNEEQISYFEKDLIAWDIANLCIGAPDDGLTVDEISSKTDSSLDSTNRRIADMIRIGILKEILPKKFNLAQNAFIIPSRPVADKLTHALVKRELEKCYQDKRNRPYTRFRFMCMDPKARDEFEAFIDNFVLDSRRFKNADGKTHYMQIVFSDRNDLL